MPSITSAGGGQKKLKAVPTNSAMSLHSLQKHPFLQDEIGRSDSEQESGLACFGQLFQFTEDKTEWKDTKIVFDVSEKGGKTEIHFTHLGLVPEYECFSVCSNAWGSYINGSLRSLIATGKGHPNQKASP
jgi:hypothetical protein